MITRSTYAIDVTMMNGLLVRTAGLPAGKALIFLHAFADSSYAFTPLFNTPLADRFRLFAVDLAGFGSSPRQDNVRTIAEHAESVARLVRSLPVPGSVGLVAHSVTSMIAVQAALRMICTPMSTAGSMRTVMRRWRPISVPIPPLLAAWTGLFTSAPSSVKRSVRLPGSRCRPSSTCAAWLRYAVRRR